MFLVVVYGFMYSHRHKFEQIPDTNYQAFYQGEKCETFKGVNFVVY